MRIIVISGRSGSGKTSALNLLEDEGFTCIDNLPVSLLPALIEQIRNRNTNEGTRLAIGIDARNIDSDLGALPKMFSSVKQASDSLTILYLEAARDVLLRRFSETRRKHPLTNNDTGLNEAITEEDVILAPLAALADVTINTTNLSLHELRSAVKNQVVGTNTQGIAITFTSFGFKFGVPVDADFMFDVRCLPNPYWNTSLRNKSGLESEVIHFLENDEHVQAMSDQIEQFARNWIPEFEKNNRSYLNFAIGCTGGMHRSVYLANTLTHRLRKHFKNVQTRHRQLEKT